MAQINFRRAMLINTVFIVSPAASSEITFHMNEFFTLLMCHI